MAKILFVDDSRDNADTLATFFKLLGHETEVAYDGDSVSKVENGTRLVADAGSTMEDIVHQVKRVNDMIGEIASASSEQSTGIGQIGDAVAQLDQVTQQNAALVEESAAAAESLNQQAAQLSRVVATFKLN